MPDFNQTFDQATAKAEAYRNPSSSLVSGARNGGVGQLPVGGSVFDYYLERINTATAKIHGASLQIGNLSDKVLGPVPASPAEVHPTIEGGPPSNISYAIDILSREVDRLQGSVARLSGAV